MVQFGSGSGLNTSRSICIFETPKLKEVLTQVLMPNSYKRPSLEALKPQKPQTPQSQIPNSRNP